MYLLDANAFMEANRMYYAFDIAPGFWSWLADPSLAGQVASIDAIKDEITAGTGDLVDWARARPDSFWLRDTDDVLDAMRELAAWATDPARQYRQEAVDEFLDSADYKLIAHAMASGATVVTASSRRRTPRRRSRSRTPATRSASPGQTPSARIECWGCDWSTDPSLCRRPSPRRSRRCGSSSRATVRTCASNSTRF
jgi:hypothetical protein